MGLRAILVPLRDPGARFGPIWRVRIGFQGQFGPLGESRGPFWTNLRDQCLVRCHFGSLEGSCGPFWAKYEGFELGSEGHFGPVLGHFVPLNFGPLKGCEGLFWPNLIGPDLDWRAILANLIV